MDRIKIIISLCIALLAAVAFEWAKRTDRAQVDPVSAPAVTISTAAHAAAPHPFGVPVKSTDDRFFLEKTLQTGPFRLVVAGDSRALSGVSPFVISQETGLNPGFNFSFPQVCWDDDYLTSVESIVDFSSHPIIILALTPISLTAAHVRSNWYLRYKRLHPAKRAKILAQTDDSLAERLVEQDPVVDRVYFEDGFTTAARMPDAKVFTYYGRQLRKFAMSDGLLDQMKEKAARWTNRGGQVFVFWMPTSDEMIRLEDKWVGEKRRAVLDGFQSAGAIPLRFNKKYGSDDGSHLDAASALEFSRDLAAALSGYGVASPISSEVSKDGTVVP